MSEANQKPDHPVGLFTSFGTRPTAIIKEFIMDFIDLFDVIDLINALRKNKLSRYEREILEQASEKGNRISIVKSVEGDEFVRIGNKDFDDESDPELRERALNTVKNLLRKHFITKDTETSYSLTEKALKAVK